MDVAIEERFKKIFYVMAGILFLTMAKTKHFLYGYKDPKPFPVMEYDRCIDYDLKVVDEWLDALEAYTGDPDSVKEKSVLELGPGSDLGTGIYLLTKGARKYSAIDINDLVAKAPNDLYEKLLERLGSMGVMSEELAYLEEQIQLGAADQPNSLVFKCRSDFNIADAFQGDKFDLIFSQATFEHFDHIPTTMEHLTSVSGTGTVLISVVDLQTHSRWIRDKDPNNIYRYGENIYNALSFSGSPNRVRPIDYEYDLRRLGWTDIVVKPLTTIAMPKSQNVCHLHSDFQSDENQMDILSFLLFATKG